MLQASGVTRLALALLAGLAAVVVAVAVLPSVAHARPDASAALVAVVPLESESRGVVATYKVQDGDSLLGIADILAVDVDTLQDVNGLPNPNAIVAGNLLAV